MVQEVTTQKAWGTTRCVVDSSLYAKHELQVVAGGYCSVHYHRERANRFIVLSGIIAVVEFYGWTCHRTLLGPDNILDIPSLVVHQFQVLESGTVIEEYWPDRRLGIVDNADIVRLVGGGRVENLVEMESLAQRLIRGGISGS